MKIEKIALLSLFLFIISMNYAKASYCDIDLQLSTICPNNTAINLSKVDDYYTFSCFDNSTNTTMNFNISMICNETKTFWLVSEENEFDLKPGDTVNFSFTIYPVAFRKYNIHSYGLFNIDDTVIDLSEPYTYNFSAVFPDIPAGQYLQAFEITNGLETKYLFYSLNNTVTIEPRILRVEILNIIYGKPFSINVVADNTESVNVSIINQNDSNSNLIENFELNKISQYYFSRDYVLKEIANLINISASNNYTTTFQEINITPQKLQIAINDITFPALTVNQVFSYKIIDFNVSEKIPINITMTAFNVGANASTDFDYFITDEDEIKNPTSARALYIYINPHSYSRGKINVNISSPLFDSRAFSIEFMGSSFTNTPTISFSYYDKPTNCVLQGNAVNSSYLCSFSLPSNIDINSLQINEFNLMKSSYENKINELSQQRLLLIIAIIIFIISIAIYYMRDKIALAIGGK